MDAIRVETGIREISIEDTDGNVATTVRINPSDMHFADVLLDTMTEIGDLYTAFLEKSEQIEKIEDDVEAGMQMRELGNKADEQIREKINNVFGKDICTPLIGNMIIWSPADGLPVWANIIFAFIDLFDDNLTKEKMKQNPKIEKYTKKYSRKRK